MGDSDDEYDRRGRGRDKFRRERNDYQDRAPPSAGRRDEWTDRYVLSSDYFCFFQIRQ